MECGHRWDEAPRTGRPRRYCSRSCQGRAYRRRRDEGRLSAVLRPTSADERSTTTLKAAVSLADAEGARAVTLRTVAVRAGVPLAAVQRDFGSRDRLVAAMVQHVLSARPRPSTCVDDPAGTLVRLAEHEWSAYASHPWLVGVIASTRPPLVPAVLDASRAVVEVFTALGLDRDVALDRYVALSGYVQGMGLLLIAEHDEARHSGTSYRTWWRGEVRRLDRTGATLRHPWLAELADRRPADDFDASACFRDGLYRVVRGLVHPAAV